MAMSKGGVSTATPKVDQRWHLQEPSGDAVGINAIEAWATTKGKGNDGIPITVVIFDTGVELDHPSFEGQIDSRKARDFENVDSRSRGAEEGLQIALSGNRETGPGMPKGPLARIGNPFDAHGTASAGIVAAKEIDAEKPVGVAPMCRLIPLRISVNATPRSLANALRYAARSGDVVLLPRFLERTSEVEAALGEAAAHVPIVCAAGNDGRSRLIFPASDARTISVGACNAKGWRSTYSQYGAGLDVVAPSNDVPIEDRDLIRYDLDMARGRVLEEKAAEARRDGRPPPREHDIDAKEVEQIALERGWKLNRYSDWSIATTDNLGDSGYNFEPAGDYCKAEGEFGFGGTSAAAAEVAGVVALILSVNPGLKNRPEEIRNILHRSASHLPLKVEGDDTRKHLEFGAGLVNAAEAVRLASEVAPPASV